MEIIFDESWIRLIKDEYGYKVQYKKWWRWKDICFGAFGPYKTGLVYFKNFPIIESEFITCLSEGKRYTLSGVI